MTFDPHAKDLVVGIAGAGATGTVLAQLAIQGGCRVKLVDERPEAAAHTLDILSRVYRRAAESGQLAADQVEGLLQRIEVVPETQGLADAPVVLVAGAGEADPDRQMHTVAELAKVCAPPAIIAVASPAGSISALAAACAGPERVAGMRVPGHGGTGKLVEIIDGLMTDPATSDALTDFAKRLGREPVRISDTPGFVVEQLSRLYCLEAANIAADAGATFEAIDRILKEGCGFAKGPFELMDQIGLDVAQTATERLYRSTFEEPRFRPTPLMQLRLEGGALGRRAGRGFYDYDAGGNPVVPDEGRMPHYDERWVWVSPEDQRISIRVKSIVKACGGVLDEGKEAHPKSLLVVTPVGEDATSCVVRQGLDPERAVAVDALFGMITRRTVMKTPVTKLGYAACALGLFAGGGAKASLIHDTPGFVAQRIVATLINAAAAIAQSGVAAPEDIDRAATVGGICPKGPLAWGDDVGPRAILAILEGLQTMTGDARYRPSAWLRRRVQLGVSLLTPES
jgi:3-hydroxybutyryl-CoA dehydrogenase